MLSVPVTVLAAIVAAAALAPAAAGAPPRAGTIVTGKTFAGIELGATAAEVRRSWGARYGVCRSCSGRTWFFNYRPFRPQGVAVAFRGGRVAALFTLWSPPGWKTDAGLRVGENVVRATEAHGPLPRVECGRYYALTIRDRRAVTALYVVGEKVWGFGLLRPGESVCR